MILKALAAFSGLRRLLEQPTCSEPHPEQMASKVSA
jgi:hypothetical protein